MMKGAELIDISLLQVNEIRMPFHDAFREDSSIPGIGRVSEAVLIPEPDPKEAKEKGRRQIEQPFCPVWSIIEEPLQSFIEM